MGRTQTSVPEKRKRGELQTNMERKGRNESYKGLFFKAYGELSPGKLRWAVWNREQKNEGESLKNQ